MQCAADIFIVRQSAGARAVGSSLASPNLVKQLAAEVLSPFDAPPRLRSHMCKIDYIGTQRLNDRVESCGPDV